MPESGERGRFSRSAFFRQSPRAVLPEKTRRRVCRCPSLWFHLQPPLSILRAVQLQEPESAGGRRIQCVYLEDPHPPSAQNIAVQSGKGLQSCHGTTAPTNHIPAGGRRRRVFAVWAAGTLLRIAGEPFWAPRRANLTLHYTRRWMGRSIQAPLSFPPVKSRVGFIPCFSFLSRALSLRFARP